MDRYWRELENAFRRCSSAKEEWRVDCPLGEPPARTGEKGRWERAWQKYVAYPLRLRWAIQWQGIDVVHVLDHSFAHLLASVPRRGPRRIVTVHDLAPLRDPGDLTAAQQQRFLSNVSHVHGADLLLADSRHSADEVVGLLDVAPEKIRVLPLGVDVARFSARPESSEHTGLPRELAGRKVVLSVGSNVARKNLGILPEVFRRTAVDGLTLLRVGAPLPTVMAEELRRVLGQDGLIELVAASDEMLVRAYQRADALIFPSRIEGFGFPVLEAMAAGCPVVCTDVTSVPEVAGDAALFFGPDDPSEAARHLSRVLTDPACRARLVAAGHERAAGFSWARHFDGLLEIYRAVVAGKRHDAL